MKELIFISSVQKELAEERQAIRDFVRGDALLGRFFDVFLFEDMPAADRRADKVYASNASVQVMRFADRLEVWNPGELLPPLTAESLRKPHRSILRNTRIAEALYLAHYIEKYGTGTLMMIRESLEHKLPEPGFGQEPGEFGITVWRDWLTEEVMEQLGLNERQMKAVVHVKIHGQITNAVYRSLIGMVRKTAARDLEDLVSKAVLRQLGATGRGAYYVMAWKRDINGTNGTRPRPMPKRDINGTNGTQASTTRARHKPDKQDTPAPHQPRKNGAQMIRQQRVTGMASKFLTTDQGSVEKAAQRHVQAHKAVTDPVDRPSRPTQ